MIFVVPSNFLIWGILHFKWKKSNNLLSINKSRQQKHV